MCSWGNETLVRIKVIARQSHTDQTRWENVGIDSCIAPIVKALQDGGIDMTGSCCGHGKYDGSILLADGRKLIIRRDSNEK